MKDFLESTLEDIIFDNRKTVHEKGLPKFHKNTLRQFILPSGKKVDLFTFEITDDVLTFSVIELKKDKSDTQTLVQAFGYVSELLEMFYDKFAACIPKIIIVGSDVKNIPLIYEKLSQVANKENLDMLMGNFYGVMKTFVEMKDAHPGLKCAGFIWIDDGKIEIKEANITISKRFKLSVKSGDAGKGGGE